jgi:hypothetical protein
MHIASLRPNFEQQLMALDQISGQNTIPVASAARHFLLFEAALAMVEDSNPTSQNKSTTREKIRLEDFCVTTLQPHIILLVMVVLPVVFVVCKWVVQGR